MMKSMILIAKYLNSQKTSKTIIIPAMAFIVAIMSVGSSLSAHAASNATETNCNLWFITGSESGGSPLGHFQSAVEALQVKGYRVLEVTEQQAQAISDFTTNRLIGTLNLKRVQTNEEFNEKFYNFWANVGVAGMDLKEKYRMEATVNISRATKIEGMLVNAFTYTKTGTSKQGKQMTTNHSKAAVLSAINELPTCEM